MRKERNLVLTSCIVQSLLCKVIDCVSHILLPNTWIFLTEKLTGSWGHSESKGSVEHFAALPRNRLDKAWLTWNTHILSWKMTLIPICQLYVDRHCDLNKALLQPEAYFAIVPDALLCYSRGKKRQRINIKWYLWWCVCTSSAGCGFISFSVSRTVI